jgi:hypothetical protein
MPDALTRAELLARARLVDDALRDRRPGAFLALFADLTPDDRVRLDLATRRLLRARKGREARMP